MEKRYFLFVFVCITGCYSCNKSDIVIQQPLNVYVAGYEFDDSRAFAKCWKNGSTVPLPAGSNKGRAMAITVSRTDVYMAGYEHMVIGSELIAVAKYWKNGRSFTLG